MRDIANRRPYTGGYAARLVASHGCSDADDVAGSSAGSIYVNRHNRQIDGYLYASLDARIEISMGNMSR